MTKLSVNLNKIALIRNSRQTSIPNLIEAADVCVNSGADGITIHPRPDMRHARPADVYELADHLNVEFNIEGNPLAEKSEEYPGFLELVKKVKPTQCTLVPDDPEQLTSDHGFDLRIKNSRLAQTISQLQDLGIRVSLFLDPEILQVELAKEIGTDRIELYTGPYAEAYGTPKEEVIYKNYFKAAKIAQEIGLGLNAGHDLNLENLKKFVQVPGLQEVSIGHALIVDAIYMGLSNAVKKYKRILS